MVDRAEKELIEQEELVEGTIVIGCGELAAVQILSEIIESFHKKYPRVSYDIFTANADLVKEQMEKGLIDIGMLLEPQTKQLVIWLVLIHNIFNAAAFPFSGALSNGLRAAGDVKFTKYVSVLSTIAGRLFLSGARNQGNGKRFKLSDEKVKIGIGLLLFITCHLYGINII